MITIGRYHRHRYDGYHFPCHFLVHDVIVNCRCDKPLRYYCYQRHINYILSCHCHSYVNIAVTSTPRLVLSRDLIVRLTVTGQQLFNLYGHLFTTDIIIVSTVIIVHVIVTVIVIYICCTVVKTSIITHYRGCW